MTKENAIRKATSKAKQFQQPYYVIYDGDGERDYFPASEEETETFYAGSEIVFSTED